MNKMIWRSFLCFALCALTFSLASCGDDDNPNSPENVTPANQNTDNGSQATASIVGNWGIDGIDDYIFFNADGTGGFMEHGSSGYHQDGAFRWVLNADGSYSFSGEGLHDGVQYMAMESYDGNTMVVNIQFEGDDKVEHLTLRRLSSNPSTPTPSVVEGKSIVGNWNIVRIVHKRYHDGVLNSEGDDVESAPYDYIAINANGTGAYMEYSSSSEGWHVDSSFRWSKTSSGYNCISDESGDTPDAMRIISYDGENRMELEWELNEQKAYLVKKVYHYYLQRQVQ